MIRDIRRKYFEVWGNEEAQNVFLKGLLISVSALFLIQSITLTVLALRKPLLVAVGNSETKVFTVTPPTEELLNAELKRLVKKYVEAHYNWDPTTIEKAHQEAGRYVSEKFLKNFVTANQEQIRLSKEKKLSQRVYLSQEPVIDSKTLIAHVQMDRILIVEGLKAASTLTLDVTFEYGARNSTNPEGVYITGEKFISQ